MSVFQMPGLDVFCVNDIVRYTGNNDLIGGPKQNIVLARGDCLAIVVDGLKYFPDMYESILKKIGNELIDLFVWVIWDKNDSRYDGQADGGYASECFELVQAPENKNYSWITNHELDEPKDNNNRTYCFWCRTKTKEIEGFTFKYNICPNCKK